MSTTIEKSKADDAFEKIASPAAKYDLVEEEKELPFWKLLIAALPWIAIQALWGTMFACTTPYMEELNLSGFWASNIWIFGPITGFFTAPLVGTLSDNCTSKYGRRRPFIVGSIIILWVVALLFAGSKDIFSSNSSARKFAMAMFFFLDVTINLIQTPTRAIVSDVVSSRQQNAAQLMSVLFQGVGNLVSFGIMRSFDSAVDSIFEINTIILVILTVLVGIQAMICKEEQYVPATEVDESLCHKIVFPFISSAKAIRYMSKELMIIVACQFFSWYALFCYLPTGSSWYIYNVYEAHDIVGDSEAIKAQRQAVIDEAGSKYSDTGLIQSGVMIVLSIIVVYALKCVRLPIMYSACLAVGALACFLIKFAVGTSVGFAVFAIVLFAVPMTAINAFPFSIIGALNKSNRESNSVGQQMGILNIFICLPQFIATMMTSSMRANMDDKDAFGWVYFVGGIALVLAAISAMFVIDPAKIEKEQQEDSQA